MSQLSLLENNFVKRSSKVIHYKKYSRNRLRIMNNKNVTSQDILNNLLKMYLDCILKYATEMQSIL